MSRWIANGGPTRCAAPNGPFPHRDDRVQVPVDKDAKLYCYDTKCEQAPSKPRPQSAGRHHETLR
jgi:hypothetical protein